MITKNKRYSLLGYPGPAGMNAYQLAVLNGFKGTEQEWLASLGGGEVGTIFTTASITGSNLLGTMGTNGLSLLVPNYLTTAAVGTGGGGGGEWSVSTKTGSNIVVSTGSTNTLYYGNFITTYGSISHTHDYQSTGNYLTTAAVSNHTHSDLYQSTGAYLTTAMQSASSSVFAKTGITTASTAGSDLVATHNTDGLSLGIPKWLTIAAGAGDGVNIIAAGGSTAASTGTYVFSNSNGISFSLNGSTITASHNALTTAAASDHTHSNLYQSTGAYLTTAALSANTSNYAGISTGSQSTAGSDVVFTHNTAGLNLGMPKYLTTAQAPGAYLTTAMASNAGSNFIAIGNSTDYATSVLSTKFLTTAQAPGNYLTTAMVSNAGSNFVGLNSAVTNMTMTVNSSGVSISNPGWLTTAAQSGHTHSDLYQTKAAYLTTAMVSNEAHVQQITVSGNTSGTLAAVNSGTLNIAGGNNITISQQGNFLTISGANVGGAQTAISGVGVSNTTYVSGTVIYSADANLTIGSSTNGASQYVKFSVGNYITTGAASDHTHSNLYQSTGAYLTTAAQSGHTHASAPSITGNISVTSNSSAWSIAIGAYLTTADLSQNSSLYLPVGNSTQWATGTLSSALMPLAYSSGFQTATLATKFLTTAAAEAHTHGAGSTASTAGVDLKFTTASNGWTLGIPAWITTGGAGGGIAASISAGGNSTSAGSGYSNITSGTMFLQGGDNITLSQNGAKISIIGATANGPASVYFSDGNGVSWASTTSGSSTTIGASVNGGPTLQYYEPSEWNIHSYSSTRGVGTLGLQPFYPPYNLSFGHLNMIGSGSVAPTSHGNTVAFRAAGNSSHGYSQSHTIENIMYEDIFLFSKGTGFFATNLFSFASTRITFGTRILESWAHSGVGPSAGSIASASLRRTMSIQVSYPAITSGTSSSINANSSATVWNTGYSSFGSTASNSNSTTYNTTNTTGNYNLASTFPAAAVFSSYKMVPMNFASSVTPGEYWIGMRRMSTTNSTLDSANNGQGANNSYTTTFQASNLTRTDQINWAGNTNTIVSSLGPFGAVSQATMGPWYGIGTLSATYDPTATYVNNMGQAAGAIAFSQIRTNVSFFRTWLQLVGIDAEGV
jgi:hypothetical protein